MLREYRPQARWCNAQGESPALHAAVTLSASFCAGWAEDAEVSEVSEASEALMGCPAVHSLP